MIPVRKFLKNPLVKRWWFVGLLAAGGGVAAYLLYRRGKVMQANGGMPQGGAVPPPQITTYGPGYGPPPALPGPNGNGEPVQQQVAAPTAPNGEPPVDPLAAYPYGTVQQRQWMASQGISPQQAQQCLDYVKGKIAANDYIRMGLLNLRIQDQQTLRLVANALPGVCPQLVKQDILTYAVATS